RPRMRAGPGSTRGSLSMIEMSCPRCGAGGRVPNNKVNSRLVCKKCLQVFHLTPGGQAVLGEPPPPKEAPKVRSPREQVEVDLSALEGLGQKLAKLKLPDVKTMAVVGVVLLVVAGIGWLLSRESLETRSNRVATAISKGDVETIVALALPGTEMEAMKWAVDTIKQHTELKISLGMQEPAKSVQVQSNTQGSSAQALVQFKAEAGRRGGALPPEDLQAVPSLGNAKKSLELILHWAPDTWGNWRLDAKRTAEVGTPGA